MHRCRDGPGPHPPPQTPESCGTRRRRRRGTRKRSAGGGAASGLVACLLFAAAAGNPPLAHAGLISGARAAAGGTPLGTGDAGGGCSGGSVGCCHRRGLAEYSTRGCFVLCVTPSTAAGPEAGTGGGGRRGSGVVTATSSVRRTRAGAVASQPLLAGAFLNRGSLGDRVAAAAAAAAGGGGCGGLGLSRGSGGDGGGGGDVDAGTGAAGGGRGLECAAKDGGKAGRARSRLRQILNKMRGGRAAPAPPVAVAAAAAGNEMMYDTSQVCCVVWYEC